MSGFFYGKNNMTERRNDNDLAQLRQEVADGRREIEELRVLIEDLVNAWRTAKGFLAFIKWTAVIGSAVAIVWATLHGAQK